MHPSDDSYISQSRVTNVGIIAFQDKLVFHTDSDARLSPGAQKEDEQRVGECNRPERKSEILHR